MRFINIDSLNSYMGNLNNRMNIWKEEDLKTYEELISYINKKHDKQIKNKLINCPNCGAPVTDIMCEYCGTVF